MEEDIVERSWLNRFLFGSISRKLILGFVLIIIVIAITGFSSLFQVQKITETLEKDIPVSINHLNKTSYLDTLAHFIEYYDEVLTMSARNYAFTSDIKWKTRYYMYAPELDDVIKKAIENGDEKDSEFFKSVGEANIRLVEMEESSIRFVDNGNPQAGIDILESEEYSIQKEIYKNGLLDYVERRGGEYYDALSSSINELNAISKNSQETVVQITYFIFIAIIITLSIAILIGYFVSRKISKPIEELEFANRQIRKKNFSTRVDIKTGDELEELGKSFNKTAEVLEKMDDEYKKLDRAKTEFLSITSHELRSPMTPMRAQLQMLTKDYFGKLNAQQKESLSIVLRNTERLDRIIQDFLEISRIEAARLKFRFLKKDLTPSIRMLAKEMTGFMPEKKVKIFTKIEKLPIISVDPDRVMQVLRNLINNAIKFSPEGRKVVISAKLDGGMILFSVADQGIGIKPADQKRIFEPFYQAEQTMYREYQGTGLGLTIIRGIVQSQNGKVWLESVIGKGTTFYFTIPLKPVLEIKPIKLLFSDQVDVERKLKNRFIEVLGPMGEKEFEVLKKTKGIDKENLYEYIDILVERKIMDIYWGEEFKKKVDLVFGGDKGVSSKELVSRGLIKKFNPEKTEDLKKKFIKK